MIKGEYEEAIEQLSKGLELCFDKLGKEHNIVADCYNMFGIVFWQKGDHYFVRQDQFNTALKYFQKAIQSLVKDFTDNSIYVNPIYIVLKGEKGKVNSAVILLETLEERGEAFYVKWKMENGRWKMEKKRIRQEKKKGGGDNILPLGE